MRNLLTVFVAVAWMAACSDNPGNNSSTTNNLSSGMSNNQSTGTTNNQSTGTTNNTDPENSVACFACGPGIMCGERCADECGCCCDPGEERVVAGERQVCTSAQCWEVAAAGVDMGIGAPDMGSSPDMNADACTEAPNGEFPTSTTCQHGGADWIAWKWVASRDIDVTTVELHTDEGFGALFVDDNGKPGAVLVEGALSAADADGWRTFDAAEPVMVSAGSTVWVGENVTTCSTAEDGVEFDYFTSDSTTGPWSGPFNAHNFTARISGSCP